MKSFKFKLASIKSIRESEEKTALDVYAASMRARYSTEVKLEKLMCDLDAAQSQIVGRRNVGMTASDLHADRNALQAIQLDIKTAKEELEEAQKEENEKRTVYLEAKASREILERLETKQKEEYLTEERRKEEQEIDDNVAARYIRNREEQFA